MTLGRVVLGLPWLVRLSAPIRWPWDTRQKMADMAGQPLCWGCRMVCAATT